MAGTELCRLVLEVPLTEDNEVISPTSDEHNSDIREVFFETDLGLNETYKNKPGNTLEIFSQLFEDRNDNLQKIDQLQRTLNELYPGADILRRRFPAGRENPEHDIFIIIRVCNLNNNAPEIKWQSSCDPIATDRTPSFNCRGDSVFVPGSNSVYSINTNSGTVQWSTETGSLNRMPLILEDSIFVRAGDDLGVFLNISDGEVINELEGLPSKYNTARPTVQNTKIYLGNRHGEIFVINAKNSSKLCSVESRINALDSTEEFIIALSESTLYGIDRFTGDIEWKTQYENLTHYLTASEGLAFLSDSDDIFAVSIQNGNKHWKANIPATIVEKIKNSGPDREWPVSFDSNENDSSTSRGGESKEISVSISFSAPPSVQDGMVFAPTNKGLVGIDLETELVSWIANEISSRAKPTTGSNTVFIPSGRDVYAVNMDSGQVNCVFQTAADVGGLTYTDDTLMFVSGGELMAIDPS